MGLLEQYAPRLHAVSARTGVPIPTLGVSFLILHEITAVLPVVLLFWIFQALGAGASLVAWLADETDQSTEAPRGSWDWRAIAHGWVVEGEKKAEGVGRRYGILGYEKRVKGEPAGQSSEGEPVVSPKQEGVRAEEVTTMDDPAARVARKAKEGGAAAGLANAIAAYVVVKVSHAPTQMGQRSDVLDRPCYPCESASRSLRRLASPDHSSSLFGGTATATNDDPSHATCQLCNSAFTCSSTAGRRSGPGRPRTGFAILPDPSGPCLNLGYLFPLAHTQSSCQHSTSGFPSTIVSIASCSPSLSPASAGDSTANGVKRRSPPRTFAYVFPGPLHSTQRAQDGLLDPNGGSLVTWG